MSGTIKYRDCPQSNTSCTMYSMQELLQNADDAGAKTVHFYIDQRKHATQKLIHPKLCDFQGPALVCFNDAAFKPEDWVGIQNIENSVKVDNPLKVGQFGIGFNSVYHITGKSNLYNIMVPVA